MKQARQSQVRLGNAEQHVYHSSSTVGVEEVNYKQSTVSIAISVAMEMSQ